MADQALAGWKPRMNRHKAGHAVAVILLFCCSSLHGAEQGTRGTAVAMSQAAQGFVASLKPEQRAKGILKFDDPARLDWHNIPKPQRKGLALGDLTAEQQELCHALLRAALSKTGYDKVVKIMSLESNLHEGEKHLEGRPLRDPQRYYLTIFGEPDITGTWGWSFEGHHLSLNFVISDGQVTSDTPSFWGANPATVHVSASGGPKVGTRTLAQEEQLAFDLLESLDDAQLQRAVISDKAPDDYPGAGEPQPPRKDAEGLPAADMTDAQKRILQSILETYCANLTPELAANRMKEIHSHGMDRVYFAWAGARKPGVGHAYRIQGPSFVLEFINVQTDPAGHKANHIHSVWRNLKGDFAIAVK